MYASRNFKTKKQFKQAVADWLKAEELRAAGAEGGLNQPITLWAPGIGEPIANGREFVEGPHFPEPHTWYAEVQVKNGIVVRVK